MLYNSPAMLSSKLKYSLIDESFQYVNDLTKLFCKLVVLADIHVSMPQSASFVDAPIVKCIKTRKSWTVNFQIIRLLSLSCHPCHIDILPCTLNAPGSIYIRGRPRAGVYA